MGKKSDDDDSGRTMLGDGGRVILDVFTHPGDLSRALSELQIDAGTIETILGALGDGEHHMPRRVASVASHSFGDLEACRQLGYHSTMAHQFLQDSVIDMLTTLGLFVTGVKAFQHGTTTADEYSAADLRRIQATITGADRVNDRQQHRRHR